VCSTRLAGMAGRAGQGRPAIHMASAKSAISKLDTEVLAELDWVLVNLRLKMIVQADVSMWHAA